MPTKSSQKYEILKQTLLSEREDLRNRIQGRLGEVVVDREPDDAAAQATYSVTRDMAAATIERERKTLEEIEGALKRIAKGNYGRCESCDTTIPDARLRALPWAYLCIDCAGDVSASPANYFRLGAAS